MRNLFLLIILFALMTVNVFAFQPSTDIAGNESSVNVSKTEEHITAKFTFTASFILRAQIRSEVEEILDRQEGITYSIKEYSALLNSEFLVIVRGPKSKVQNAISSVQHWLSQYDRD